MTQAIPERIEAIRWALEQGNEDDGFLYVCQGPPYCNEPLDSAEECIWCYKIPLGSGLSAEAIENNIIKQQKGH